MKLSALLAVSALLAEGVLAISCKDGLNYCGRSIKLKNPAYDEEYHDRDLVHCQKAPDNLRRVEICYGGCIEAPDGQSDYCAPFGGFIMTTATENCVELVDAIHRDQIKAAEKKSKSVAKVWRLEADFAFFNSMTICVLLSGDANKGRSEEAVWEQAFNFYKDATVRLQNDLKELNKEQKN